MRDDLHHHTHLNKVIFVFPAFAILAQERKFESIWAILADPTTSSHWLPRNALHTLCQYQPTEKVVRRVISLLSITCDLEVDSHGRTPLHIAAANGSDVNVLRLLLGDACSTAASVLDAASRFPLHYAAGATTTRQLRDSDQTDDDLENSILTVQLLLETFPAAVLAKDGNGKKAIDLALECSKHQRLVACLHLESKILPRRNCVENDVHTESTETNTEEESSSHGSGYCDDNSIQSPIVVFDPDVSDFLKRMSTQSRPEHDDDETYIDDDDLSSLGTFGVSQVFVPCARRRFREYTKVEF